MADSVSKAISETFTAMGSVHSVVDAVEAESDAVGEARRFGREVGDRLVARGMHEHHAPEWLAKKARDEMYRLVVAAMAGVNEALGNEPDAGW